jgi:flagellar basal body rod protein FlgC
MMSNRDDEWDTETHGDPTNPPTTVKARMAFDSLLEMINQHAEAIDRAHQANIKAMKAAKPIMKRFPRKP